MKHLLLTLLLISPFSFADWGDVYYCEMTAFFEVTGKGEQHLRPLEKFKFTLDNTEKEALLFGKSGYLGGSYIPIDRASTLKNQWVARDHNSHIILADETSFFLTENYGAIGSTLIYADCDKF